MKTTSSKGRIGLCSYEAATWAEEERKAMSKSNRADGNSNDPSRLHYPRADWSYIEAATEVLKTWAPSKRQFVQWSRCSRSGRNNSTYGETAEMMIW